jgi:hypothetical protein
MAETGQKLECDLVMTLPEELARQIDKKTVLERVFQPAKGRTAVRRLACGPATHVLRPQGCRRAPLALPSLPLLCSSGRGHIPLILAAWWLRLGRAAFAGLLAFDVLPLVLFAILGAATGLLFDVLFRLPKNDFGICTGSGPVDPANPDMPPQDDAGVAPLTHWLHELFQSVAARSGTPGDLW